MQTTSATWKALASGGRARLETMAVIAGTEYREISAPVIERALMQGGLSVGNAVAATCRLSVMNAGTIPKAAEVKVRMRLTDGGTASEWLPAGTFYIGHRSRDRVTGLVTLECYDALLKANAVYEAPAGAEWPRAMGAVVAELAAALGVELDGRTVIRAGEGYAATEPTTGATIRDVLSGIAAAHGANWIITPEGRLRLVPVVSAAGAEGAAADVIDVAGVTGSVGASEPGTITGLRYSYGDGGETVLVGDETGIVATAQSPYFTAQNVEALYGALRGATYQAFSLQGAIYDPAAELGDWVRSREDVRGVLNGESATLDLAFRGNLSSPEPGELADEYPYIGGTKQAMRVLAEDIRELGESVRELGEGIILGVDVEYAQSQSPAEPPTAGWATEAPQWREGWYIWQRTATTTAAGTAYSEPACVGGRDGEKGADGEKGDAGVGVSAIVEEYYLSDSDSAQVGGAWSAEQPAWQSGKYIWTRSRVLWTDGAETNTPPVLARAINGANQSASEANAAVTALDGALNQREIFNRLTNGGATQGVYLKDGKLYINGTYIDTGTLDADLLTTGIITDRAGNNYWNLDSGELVTRQGNIGDFTLAEGTLRYGSLQNGGTGASVGKGGISYAVTYSDTGNTAMVQIVGAGMKLFWNGVEKFQLYLSDGDLSIRNRASDGSYDYPMTIFNQGLGQVYFRRSVYVAEQKNVTVTGQVAANRVTSVTPIGLPSGGTGQALAASPSMQVDLGSSSAADVFQESPRPGVTGTLGAENGGTGLTASPSMLIDLGSSSAADVFQQSPRPGVTGVLSAENGGTGASVSPSMLVNVGSVAAADVFQASPRPGITGTLPISHGGTGATTAQAARANLGLSASLGVKYVQVTLGASATAKAISPDKALPTGAKFLCWTGSAAVNWVGWTYIEGANAKNAYVRASGEEAYARDVQCYFLYWV